MASGLQCPGCGHVHPAGLPEIARGDATFRCYGCYRTLSVPEGWTGRPSPRSPAPEPGPVGAVPPGTRDARTARLAGRRRSFPGGTGASDVDSPTQMVPIAGAAVDGSPPGPASTDGGGAGSAAKAPLGWVAPRRSGRPVPTPVRALVWAAAFGVAFVVTALVLRAVGLLDVNTAINVYAGSGAPRFGVLLVLLPLWAVLSAAIAHFSLEGLARRRRPRPASPRPPAKTPTTG